MRSLRSLPKDKVNEFVRFIAVITAVVLVILVFLMWFDYIDEFDSKVRDCAQRGGQTVKIYNQTTYSCVTIQPVGVK
jgi:hypothetical protein